jgi:membrane associated rhomboid family serine protease
LPRTLEDHLAGREHGSFNPFFPVQLVSYALLHRDFWHIFFNLLFLFFFGPELEASLGRRSFLRLYVGGAAAGGLCQWSWYLAKGIAPLVNLGLSPVGADGSVIGASGAVFAVMVLFALKWPHRTILIWGLLPVPVWAAVGFDVLANVLGFIGSGEGAAVSFLAHLGGAAFALVWFRSGDVLERAAQTRRLAKAGKARAEADGDRREMDRILAKIQASGLGSLDGREREFLERRSRQLRDQGR